MMLQNKTSKYLWIILLVTAVLGLINSISIARERTDSATEMQNALAEAVTTGDIAVIRRLLDMGVDINPIKDNEATPLFLASKNGHTEIVRLLLNAGADINANPFKYTPHRDYEITYTPTALLPVIQHSEILYDATALHAASLNGHAEIVKLLLEFGANVEAPGNDDATALHAASLNGHTEIVKLLLEAGANVNAEIARSFYREPDHLVQSMRRLQPISPPMAILNYHTPLILASQKGHVEIVKLLLEAGATINTATYAGTAVGAASQNGHMEIVKLLLEAGVNGDGSSAALIQASASGHTEIARLLLEAGANVNTKGHDNTTALHAASLNGHVEIVKLLLEAGANINAETIRTFYGEPDPPVLSMRRLGPLRLPMAVLNNYTPLFLASHNGHTAIAELLIENGADVNKTTTDNVTALHLASRNGHMETVKLLIGSGVNTHTRGEIEGGNYTALDLANINGHAALAELLKEYSAKP